MGYFLMVLMGYLFFVGGGGGAGGEASGFELGVDFFVEKFEEPGLVEAGGAEIFAADVEGWGAGDTVELGADVVVEGDFFVDIGVAEVGFELFDVAVRGDVLEEVGEGVGAGGAGLGAPEGLVGVDGVNHLPEVTL